jgi:alkyl hydroperoxide reductase subunit AhpC
MIDMSSLYLLNAQEASIKKTIHWSDCMLTVGDKFPQFNLKATVSTESVEKAFFPIAHDTYKGKWLCVFFYPKDFTFVCPTEIKGFGDLNEQFADRDCQVLAASTDSEFVHLAWRKDHKDLRDLPFPMLADTAKRLSSALGILDAEEGVAKRATFLVDPDGIIRFAYVTDGSVGRNPQEVLRVLDALQTDELCPCNWTQGEQTLKAA